MTAPKVIALTGGSGFVGSNVLTHLLQAGYKIRLLSRNPKLTIDSSLPIKVIHGGLHDQTALKQLISGCHSVVHCAGRVRGQNFSKFQEDNSLATHQLHSLVHQDKQIKQFIYISSLAARHPQLSNYAKSKKLAEDAIVNQPKAITIRPPALYGPKDTELKPLFDGMKLGISLIPGNKENRFSLLHISDLCQIILLGLDDKLAYNHVYEPDDGKTNGYCWTEINAIASRVFQRKVYAITVPKALLKSLAYTNMLLSTIKMKSPMLSPDKVNELCFPEWIADPQRSVPNWQAGTAFEEGLKSLYYTNY